MKKVSLSKQLKDSEEAAALVVKQFQERLNHAWLVNEERVRRINELTSHNKVQSDRLTKLDAIYKPTMALAEKLALEKDALANANAKLVFMLDEIRIRHNALSENYNKLVASR